MTIALRRKKIDVKNSNDVEFVDLLPVPSCLTGSDTFGRDKPWK